MIQVSVDETRRITRPPDDGRISSWTGARMSIVPPIGGNESQTRPISVKNKWWFRV